ncbi:MAG: tRNA 4-thiouridine(8) synthase ThiI [Deltaproteobacteria bacterium RBG_13_58_19]|nr:MAG: tRNA 4-thiouridine(8) synthase ThiI [Deltaproteobacteria bacterium RBG_13_58_19]
MVKKIRGLGLLSGGLDSMLASLVLMSQGIEVVGVCFTSPFFGAAKAREAAAQLNIALREIDLSDKYLPLLYHPPHGWGRGHNPCIDCHILMLREAGALMLAEGFDFLFTGEVLGQRPMSQNRGSLNLVARESGFPELVLRPLSAKLLKPTQPELLGWVDRERLLDLSGRGRKRQMALAREYGISSYPAPAGGCLLTDPGYALRLKELLKHRETVSPRELELLKWGRHFRLPGGAKAIVGRTHRENEALMSLTAPEDLVLDLQNYPGPKVLLPGGASSEEIEEAAGLAAAYGDAPTGAEVAVVVQGDNHSRLVHLTTPTKDQFRHWLI